MDSSAIMRSRIHVLSRAALNTIAAPCRAQLKDTRAILSQASQRLRVVVFGAHAQFCSTRTQHKAYTKHGLPHADRTTERLRFYTAPSVNPRLTYWVGLEEEEEEEEAVGSDDEVEPKVQP